jgi:hypothetical protein
MSVAEIALPPHGLPLGLVAPDVAGAYRILTDHERVISEDKAHAQNESDLRLYTKEEFRAAAITVTTRQIKDAIIPSMVRDVAEVVEKRWVSAKKRARENYEDFGFTDPEQVDLAAEVATALLDPWFTKGTHGNVDPKNLRTHVGKCLDEGTSINLAANMLPCKIPSPIKTAGKLPDFSEVSVLCRLAEITGVVDALCAHAGHGDIKAVFNIVHDGTFFQDSLGFSDEAIQTYKEGLAWWTKALGFEDRIAAHQYTDLLDNPAIADMKEEFLRTRQEARDVLHDVLDPIFDPKDMQATLTEAIARDPYPDTTNPEGRFVPLLKSVMYSVGNFPLIEEFADLMEIDHRDLYRDVTKSIFQTLSDISLQDAENAIAGGAAHVAALPPSDAKEVMRIYVAQKVWEATKEYMALTAGHRNLEEDLLKKIIGLNVIRFTVHPKPGQVGFIPGTNGDHTLAWHGVGIVRTSHSKLKEGCETRLKVEGEGGIPVLVAKNGDDEASPLNALADEGQPFCYVTRSAIVAPFSITNGESFVDRFATLLKRTL